VIVDSEIVFNAVLAEVLTRIGCPTSAEEATALYSGHRWADCHKLIGPALGRPYDPQWLENLVAEAMAARVEDVLAIEGIEAFLAQQAHRQLAIASSSDRAWLDAFLARLSLADYFGDHVYSAAGLARGKPHPDVYLMAADRLDVPPSECLVIEDHPVGAAAGAAAGMTVIGLLAASHIGDGHGAKLREAGARAVASDYREVAAIVARLEGSTP
jgi:HAD superfamily hydrolase (TIGR01509 family)